MDEILWPRAAAEPSHSVYRATMADGRGDNDARQRTAWSRDEEKKLLSAQDRLGNNRKGIALELLDRTAKMCRLKFARLSTTTLPPADSGAEPPGPAGEAAHGQKRRLSSGSSEGGADSPGGGTAAAGAGRASRRRASEGAAGGERVLCSHCGLSMHSTAQEQPAVAAMISGTANLLAQAQRALTQRHGGDDRPALLAGAEASAMDRVASIVAAMTNVQSTHSVLAHAVAGLRSVDTRFCAAEPWLTRERSWRESAGEGRVYGVDWGRGVLASTDSAAAKEAMLLGTEIFMRATSAGVVH